ncbi:MAG: hypothetical protein PHQ66_00625 [Candidatus Nanoarchaeia archaeon]|nr:hypothetical protein [Candidatus Nanoarchaeia archaeon]MDD5358518.1 hypothetical protein [Candidatus Nanoarchaeia archaeon]MDD5589032.1 hypothetical protein [Candidatus Nanoarchaeia archaeon]
MDKDFLERIAKQLASDYLSCLNNPKKLDTTLTPSRTIILYNSSDEEFNQFKKSMDEYFATRDLSIKIISEKEIDSSKNHNYKINVRSCLDNPPKLY